MASLAGILAHGAYPARFAGSSMKLNYHFLMGLALAALVSASVYAFVAVVVIDIARGMR